MDRRTVAIVSLRGHRLALPVPPAPSCVSPASIQDSCILTSTSRTETPPAIFAVGLVFEVVGLETVWLAINVTSLRKLKVKTTLCCGVS
jgi:hypothetical protein